MGAQQLLPPMTLILCEGSEKVTLFFGVLIMLRRIVVAGKCSGDCCAGGISDGGGCC